MFILYFEKETNNDFVGFGEPQVSLHLVYVQL